MRINKPPATKRAAVETCHLLKIPFPTIATVKIIMLERMVALRANFLAKLGEAL
jgi:hypothetical protein